MIQPKITIAEELESKVLEKFLSLPLESKLVVYARIVHGNQFKAQNNDLFGLNRRLTSKIYRTFIEELKDSVTSSGEINRYKFFV